MRLIEWYLGLPSAGPGQGTEWGIVSQPVWSGILPTWAGLLVLLASVAGVVGIYLGDARSMSRLKIGILAGFRLVSLAALLVMLARLTLTVTRTGMPTLAILIDTSASMGLQDQYTEPAAVAATRRPESSPGGSGSPTRLEIVQQMLTRDEGRILEKLSETHRLMLFQFDVNLRELQPANEDDAQGVPGVARTIGSLTAGGDESRPATAVREVLDKFRGSPPTALVILTDGIPTTDDEALSAATSLARDRSVPLIPLGVGSDAPAKDVELYDVLADDLVFADDPVTFSFQLKGFGYEGKTAKVVLRRQGDQGVLQTAEVELAGDGQATPADLTHVPEVEGDLQFEIEVLPLPGETNASNNSAIHNVEVRREQLRVLLVERVPRWEFRHLKPLLERDPAIDVHTVLQQADISFADEDLTALPRFPVRREDLFEYDVVILGDVDLSFLSPGALDHLEEFVAERGGGLLLIAGELHNPIAYVDTPLEDLLPVEIRELGDTAERLPGFSPTGFRPELTIDGRTRAALRLVDSMEENDRLWRRLPPLYWLHEAGRRKPGAQVLAVHPTRHGEGGPLPVIVSQRFGGGQVVFHATDELWQWRQRVEDRYYGRYWLQMIRYLSRSKLRSDARGIELATDRSIYQQGESVEIRARFLDAKTVPAADDGAKAVVEGPGGRRETVTLVRLPEAPNLFSGRVSQLTAGNYHAWLAEPAPGPAVNPDAGQESPNTSEVPSVDFRVELAASELRDRAFREADLREAASRSRGAYYPFWDVEHFADEIPQGRAVPVSSEVYVPLWNRWELLVVFTGLLAGEWIIRKRSGLL